MKSYQNRQNDDCNLVGNDRFKDGTSRWLNMMQRLLLGRSIAIRILIYWYVT